MQLEPAVGTAPLLFYTYSVLTCPFFSNEITCVAFPASSQFPAPVNMCAFILSLFSQKVGQLGYAEKLRELRRALDCSTVAPGSPDDARLGSLLAAEQQRASLPPAT